MIVEFEIKLGKQKLIGSVYTDNLSITYSSPKRKEKILKEILKNNIEIIEMRVKEDE